MSSDFDIIKSPVAERMLNRVTKGFYDRSFIGLWLYEVIGREYDEMAEWVRELKNEINPGTCTWSIAIWEWLYGFEPDESMTLLQRQRRIMAKILAVAPMNPEVIRRGVAALAGGNAEVVTVVENIAPYTFEVDVNTAGEPFDYSGIWQYICEIKPSHLSFKLKRSESISTSTYTASALQISQSVITTVELEDAPLAGVMYIASSVVSCESVVFTNILQ